MACRFYNYCCRCEVDTFRHLMWVYFSAGPCEWSSSTSSELHPDWTSWLTDNQGERRDDHKSLRKVREGFVLVKQAMVTHTLLLIRRLYTCELIHLIFLCVVGSRVWQVNVGPSWKKPMICNSCSEISTMKSRGSSKEILMYWCGNRAPHTFISKAFSLCTSIFAIIIITMCDLPALDWLVSLWCCLKVLFLLTFELVPIAYLLLCPLHTTPRPAFTVLSK